MNPIDRKRIQRERREERVPLEQRLLKAWLEHGEEKAAAGLTEIYVERGEPCQDCGDAIEDDPDIDQRVLEKNGLLVYGPGPVCEPCWDARERLQKEEYPPRSSEVYTYQADVVCADCGLAIRRRLEREGKAPKPREAIDERNYDSDDYPKGPLLDGGGEADVPQHCGMREHCLDPLVIEGHPVVGAWLGNSLSEEGENYVKESLKDDPTRLAIWWAKQYDIDLPGTYAGGAFTCSRCHRSSWWYGEASCGACGEDFCAGCQNEGGAHPGYHSCYEDDDEDDEDEDESSETEENPGRSDERRAARGDKTAEARLLRTKVASGALKPHLVEGAAALGHPVTRLALGEAAPKQLPTDEYVGVELRALAAMAGPYASASWAADCLEMALGRIPHADPRLQSVVDLVREFVALGIAPAQADSVRTAAYDVLSTSESGTDVHAAADAAFALAVGVVYFRPSGEWDLPFAPAVRMATQATGAVSGSIDAARRAEWLNEGRKTTKADRSLWAHRRLASYLLGEVTTPHGLALGDEGTEWNEHLEKKSKEDARIRRLIDEALSNRHRDQPT